MLTTKAIRSERRKTTSASFLDTGTLVLNDCKVPVENVIKGVGNGFPIAMNVDNSRIGIAAQALGIAQGVHESVCNTLTSVRPSASQSPTTR